MVVTWSIAYTPSKSGHADGELGHACDGHLHLKTSPATTPVSQSSADLSRDIAGQLRRFLGVHLADGDRLVPEAG